MSAPIRLAPRLLPSAILVMTGLLAVKVVDLAQRVPDPSRPAAATLLPIGTSAQAARVTAEPFRPAADDPQARAQANQPGAQTQTQTQAQPQTQTQTQTQAQAPAAAPAPAAQPEQPAASAAERAVLEELRARRAALDAREQAMAVRESVLAATEQRLTRRVEELGALQQRLEALDKAAREREDAGWRGLVRIYENMRPRDAARIFNELEMVTLVEVVDRMKERSAAPILAGMEPDKAKALTAELARRRAGGPRAEAGG
jgi:flagellar motility protein MotE (MotC chaperone)